MRLEDHLAETIALGAEVWERIYAGLPPAVPHTKAMDRRLETLDESTRVVGVKDGLPVVEARSGRRLVLTTLGHLERA